MPTPARLDRSQCERTEPIVRRAEYGKGPTPAQMIEARAAKKSKRSERAS